MNDIQEELDSNVMSKRPSFNSLNTLLKREMVLGHHFLRESEVAEPGRQRHVCSSVEKPCRLGGRWVT